MHWRGDAGGEGPVVNAGAGIFSGNDGGCGGRRSFGAIEKLDVDDIERRWAYVADSMREGTAGEGVGRNCAGGSGRCGAFLFVEGLLGDGSRGEVDGDAVVDVRVIEGAFAGRKREVENHDGIIFEDDVVEGLVFDGDGRGGFLAEKKEGQEREKR